MTAIDFPDSPTTGQLFTVGEITWEWTGTVWQGLGTPTPGPAGANGTNGTNGTPGVVAATTPVTYNSGTQTVGLTQSFINQTVRVFADAGARATAILTPTEGMLTYLQSTDLVQSYNGSAWVNVGTTNSALEFITAYPIGTAVTSVTVPDVFNSTYDHYRIHTQGSSNTTNGTRLRLAFNNATATYYGGGIQTLFSSGAVSSNWDNNVSRFNNIGNNSEMYVDIFNPFLVRNTRVSASFFTTVAAGNYTGYILNAVSSTGFTISVEGGTMTGGTIAVYGYRKA